MGCRWLDGGAGLCLVWVNKLAVWGWASRDDWLAAEWIRFVVGMAKLAALRFSLWYLPVRGGGVVSDQRRDWSAGATVGIGILVLGSGVDTSVYVASRDQSRHWIRPWHLPLPRWVRSICDEMML